MHVQISSQLRSLIWDEYCFLVSLQGNKPEEATSIENEEPSPVPPTTEQANLSQGGNKQRKDEATEKAQPSKLSEQEQIEKEDVSKAPKEDGEKDMDINVAEPTTREPCHEEKKDEIKASKEQNGIVSSEAKDEGDAMKSTNARANLEKRRRQEEEGESADNSSRRSKAAKRIHRRWPLTLSELSSDPLMQLAEEKWLFEDMQSEKAFSSCDSELIQKLYYEELGGNGKNGPPPSRLVLLDVSQYLEKYLWPHLDPKIANSSHILSIVIILNEKFRQGVPAWDIVTRDSAKFKTFFRRLIALRDEHRFSNPESISLLEFLDNAFQSLENEAVRKEVLRLVGLPLWNALSQRRLELELSTNDAQLRKAWENLKRREEKLNRKKLSSNHRPESSFLPSLISEFFEKLESAISKEDSKADKGLIQYCERFVRFVMELMSQLPTRRFSHALLDDKAFLTRCSLSRLFHHPAGKLFSDLVVSLRAIVDFPVADHTGDALTYDNVSAVHYQRIQQLQRLFFKYWPMLREEALSNCGTLQKREHLLKLVKKLNPEELRLLVINQLRLIDESVAPANNVDILEETMISAYERRPAMKDLLEKMPLYPTETLLLDREAVPEGTNAVFNTSNSTLNLPRLNMQFLTLSDYLMRNFHLFRMETAYEVREDVAGAVKRIRPHIGDDGTVQFAGWSRTAHPPEKFAIIEIQRPKLGENRPAAVVAEINIDIKHMRPEIQSEWDELRQHDVLFLLSLNPEASSTFDSQKLNKFGTVDWLLQGGLRYVRGCEIIEIRDEENKLMNDFTGRVLPEERGAPAGTKRTLIVTLDPAQYVEDIESGCKVYDSFNLLLRRKAKENNFKAVLESIRDLIHDIDTSQAIPTWLRDVILGYGDPSAAQYAGMESSCTKTIDFKDTFLDAEHLRNSLSGYNVVFDVEHPKPPFKATFSSFSPMEVFHIRSGSNVAVQNREERSASMAEAASATPILHVKSYQPPDPGPYEEDKPPLNSVRFTAVQSAAILSGVQPGLTVIVGPPGTGKTDTAVQILHLLYHNYPKQRTLIITHSNQALNDIFQKILERDIPSRYLLRLGMGEAELDTEEAFSRVGRVNAMLERRLQLLAQVQHLSRTLRIGENMEYTCESAGYFWLLHVLARWERFASSVKSQRTAHCVAESFPFSDFFSDAPMPLFMRKSFDEDWSKAMGCFRHLQCLFQELEELRPFEMLKTQNDRINYLLTKQAKIVAMTCTYAALKRRELLQLGFTYDNLVMEEAAQVLEIETALPLLLQKPEDGQSSLKRVVLIGDHHQLPPVVKNAALQRFSHMDQSMFLRLIRLGTPYIELNAQGRARPSIAALYNWRYKELGNLPAVTTGPSFLYANAGFAYEYQLVDVPDFLGKGESEPVQYFYQNLGEAEYIVSVYQYMRLLGYPSSRISILTTYNGQRALLQDVVERRCANHPLFGKPRIVATVDKYQGQQNDYVLLSLVRTQHFGHLRDVRRLVVAMSRARLGLYIFARAGLFSNCYELEPAFKRLLQNPIQLCLTPGERFGETRRELSDHSGGLIVEGVEHMASIVQSMAREITR